MIDFSERMRIERKRMEMTQEELARRVGVSRISITKYECWAAEPSFNIAAKIAEILGLPLDNMRFHKRKKNER